MAYTQDDGFHEIQLNGKQLVFLFMAATVVSVVIFLCGVLVGRGVRAERGDLVQTVATDSASTDVLPAPPAGATLTPAPAAGDPSAAAPPSLDELSYFNRLEKPNPPAETLKTPEKEPPAPSAPERTAPAPAAATPAAAKPASPPAPAAGPGYVVQIAALNVRSEADAMAKRLASKGYEAYVVTPADRSPAVFRVRIGSFKTKREAEAMAARLKKEEQITPWVTPR